MEKASITIKPEENIKASGFRIENKATESWSMPIKTDMKATGSEGKDLGKELMNTLMEILTQESGKMTRKTDTECCKWQQVIFTKETGSMVKRTVSVLVFSYLGKYRFTNGDIYEGNFKNGNR